jgi:hypothetical protein
VQSQPVRATIKVAPSDRFARPFYSLYDSTRLIGRPKRYLQFSQALQCTLRGCLPRLFVVSFQLLFNLTLAWQTKSNATNSFLVHQIGQPSHACWAQPRVRSCPTVGINPIPPASSTRAHRDGDFGRQPHIPMQHYSMFTMYRQG